MTNAQLDAEKTQYLADWEHRHEDRLIDRDEMGGEEIVRQLHGEIDMEYDADEGHWDVEITCCDDDGNAVSLGIDERFEVVA